MNGVKITKTNKQKNAFAINSDKHLIEVTYNKPINSREIRVELMSSNDSCQILRLQKKLAGYKIKNEITPIFYDEALYRSPEAKKLYNYAPKFRFVHHKFWKDFFFFNQSYLPQHPSWLVDRNDTGTHAFPLPGIFIILGSV